MKPKAWSNLDNQIIRMNLEDKTYSLALRVSTIHPKSD